MTIIDAHHPYPDDYRARLVPPSEGDLCACGGIRRYHAPREGGGCDDCGCVAFRPLDPEVEFGAKDETPERQGRHEMRTVNHMHMMLDEGNEVPLTVQVDTDYDGDPLDGHTRISFSVYGSGLDTFSITGDRQAVVATIRDLWDALYAAYPCVGVADEDSDPDPRDMEIAR